MYIYTRVSNVKVARKIINIYIYIIVCTSVVCIKELTVMVVVANSNQARVK